VGDEDKQFEATPHKLKKAREEGQVIKSKDASTALFLIVMFSLIYYMSPLVFSKLAAMFILIFEQIPKISIEEIGEMYIFTIVVVTLIFLIGPFLSVALLTAAAGDFF